MFTRSLVQFTLSRVLVAPSARAVLRTFPALPRALPAAAVYRAMSTVGKADGDAGFAPVGGVKGACAVPLPPPTPVVPLPVVDDPFLSPVFRTMSEFARPFAVASDSIDVIDTPAEFYNELMTMVSTARSRVLLSALYLGSASSERALADALASALVAVPSLTAHLLFDAARGRRKDSDGASSFSLAEGLVQQHPERVSAAFYTPPLMPKLPPGAVAGGDVFAEPVPKEEKRRARVWKALKPLLRGRGGELLSVHHMKIYIADDTLIISGANLSDVYFTARQDRYWRIKDKALCDALAAAALAVSAAPESTLLPESPTGAVPRFWLADAGEGAEAGWLAAAPSLAHAFAGQGRAALAPNGALSAALKAFLGPSASTTVGGAETVIFPSLQIASIGIRQDERAFAALLRTLSHVHQGVAVSLATGYFNVTPAHCASIDAFLEESHGNKMRVIVASKQANGWADARGLTSIIPHAYSRLLNKFLRRPAVSAAAAAGTGAPPRVEACEYGREGWSFHAKGLWAQPVRGALPQGSSAPVDVPAVVETSTTEEPSGGWGIDPSIPLVSVIGSSNFGERSVHRDSECQLTVLTTSPVVARKAGQELAACADTGAGAGTSTGTGAGTGAGAATPVGESSSSSCCGGGSQEQEQAGANEEEALGAKKSVALWALLKFLKGYL